MIVLECAPNGCAKRRRSGICFGVAKNKLCALSNIEKQCIWTRAQMVCLDTKTKGASKYVCWIVSRHATCRRIQICFGAAHCNVLKWDVPGYGKWTTKTTRNNWELFHSNKDYTTKRDTTGGHQRVSERGRKKIWSKTMTCRLISEVGLIDKGCLVLLPWCPPPKK